MNKALKHTIIAMATASLGFAAGCSSDEEAPEAAEATAGSEEATEASCAAAEEGAPAEEGAAEEASCGEGSCG